MVQSESSTEPLIKGFRRLLKNWDKLWKPQFGASQLKAFVAIVRSQLKKIYGTDAPQLLAFAETTGSGANVHEEFARLMAHAKRMVESLESMPTATATPLLGKRVFIGHGRSHLWRELKDFIAERLFLPWDEFNRESVAGITTSDRLQDHVIRIWVRLSHNDRGGRASRRDRACSRQCDPRGGPVSGTSRTAPVNSAAGRGMFGVFKHSRARPNSVSSR